MPRSPRPFATNRRRWAGMVLAATAGVVLTSASPAQAGSSDVIVLPGATSAEGIARGEDDMFYAGDLFRGDIFRGDLEDRTAELFIDAPDGRLALGMSTDLRYDLLFVAGGFTGQAYVYDLESGATVATYQFTPPSDPDAPAPTTLINDVTVTRDGAWFTDSLRGVLFFVPVNRDGEPGEFRTLMLEGPAADTSGEFDLNGIAATRHGRTLIVAHTTHGKLYTVDTKTGESTVIAGVSVPGVDGIVVRGAHLWAVQGLSNQITEVRLTRNLMAGSVVEIITDKAFRTPSTAIHFDGRLAVVNAHFDTGIPPTADQYEVVLVED